MFERVPNHAVFSRRVFVAFYLVGNGFGAHVHHPGQCKAKEEPLIGSFATNYLIALVLFGFPEGLVTHNDSAQIGKCFRPE